MPRFRLRTILILVNLFVLIVPLGSIYFFRIYENELVRQTETELIDQGAFITALYKQALMPLVQGNANYGRPVEVQQPRTDDKYTAMEPKLDLFHTVLLPPRPDAISGAMPPDAQAQQAAQSIFQVIDTATLTTLAGIRIVDSNGIVVAGREEKGLSLAQIDEVASALKGEYTAVVRQRISKHAPPPFESLSRGTNVRVFVAMPVIDGNHVLGAVYLSRTPRNVIKGLFDNSQTVAIAGGIILAITIVLALLISYAISRPIYALIAQTQRIGRSDQDFRPIDAPVTKEIALLSESISQMAQTIAARSEYIRTFAMHVSHEFKTPLTAIQGAIELIQEHGGSMSGEQLNKFLSNTTKDTERLGKLVSRLLEMARADVLQPKEESCDLAHEIKELQQAYIDKGLSIVSHMPEAASLPLPAEIIQTVLTNLFENSLQHGATQVTVDAVLAYPEPRITITDNGSGISPANAEKLFVPFFTTKRDNGGTGLGLVIIRSMLNAYHATIRHTPTQSGTSFTISLEQN